MTELSDVLADQDLLRRVGAALVGVSVAELIAEIEPSLELTQSQITGLVAALAATTPLPTGTPVIGQVPVVTDDSPLALGWGSGGGGGGGAVDSVNGQTGIVVLDAADVGAQPSDADLSALAAAGNSAVLAATTASFTTADETKLDGIEAGADVTDAANVAAAGAVMVIQTKEQALTNHTTVGTTVEQWGIEEVVFDNADFGSSVCVEAHLYGQVKRVAASQAARAGEAQLQASFDGGASWADISPVGILAKWELVTGTTTYQANNRMPIATAGVSVGTPTGDVMVRARVITANAAGDPVFESGRIIATCRNANAGDGPF